MLRVAALGLVLAPLTACSGPQNAPDDEADTDSGPVVAACGTATEARAATVVRERLGAVPVVFGSGVRADVVLPDVAFAAPAPGAQLEFANACIRCTTSQGPGIFDDGSAAATGFNDRNLIDLDAADAWVLSRVEEARDGALTFGVETFLLAPMWTMAPFVRGPDAGTAAANDSYVFSVSAAWWLAASVALVPGNDCAAAELRRLRSAGLDVDRMLAAMGEVLTASGGEVRVSIMTTAAEDALTADVACTTSTLAACIDALPALAAQQPPLPGIDVADAVMRGDDPSWRAATFLAQPVSTLPD